MKNLFSLAAAGALTVAAFGAQAQITVDGTLSTAEIGTGVGKYQLASTYTNTHSDTDRGLQSMYVGYSATTLNIMVVGAIEATGSNYRAMVVYLNTPGRTGIARGTQLPGGNDGSSPLSQKPTMDMETDYGFRVNVGGTGNGATDVYFSRVTYVSGSTVAANTDTYIGSGNKSGTAVTSTTTNTPDLPGLVLAYKNSSAISTNTTNTGLEISIPLASLSGTTTVGAGSQVQVFAGYTDTNGVYYSDVLPQVTGQTAALGTNPNFATLPGTQAATFALGTGPLATRSEAATALRFSVYPNPGTAAQIAYTVPQGKQPVALSVFDATGRRVRTLATEQAGAQSYPLADLAAGVYVVKLDVADLHASQKVVVE